jgi:hypothetical protein
VEANSTGGQGSRRAVAPSGDDDDDNDDQLTNVEIGELIDNLSGFCGTVTA